MCVTLEEMFDGAHLAYRVGATERRGQRLLAGGVPVLQPFGAHAVYVDGRVFLPHLPDEQFPAWSLSAAYYLAGGVRIWESGNITYGRFDPAADRWSWPALDLLRLAVPRRVYFDAHPAYAADALVELLARREEVHGLRCTYRPRRCPSSSPASPPWASTMYYHDDWGGDHAFEKKHRKTATLARLPLLELPLQRPVSRLLDNVPLRTR